MKGLLKKLNIFLNEKYHVATLGTLRKVLALIILQSFLFRILHLPAQWWSVTIPKTGPTSETGSTSQENTSQFANRTEDIGGIYCGGCRGAEWPCILQRCPFNCNILQTWMVQSWLWTRHLEKRFNFAYTKIEHPNWKENSHI